MPTDNNDELQGIAIIGMAGRFPGADSIDTFWRNLRDGVESVRFFTREELLAAGIPANLVDHPDYVAAKGVMDDAEMFDAGFFGYTPREATVMDPQHRVFLECTWAALEDAGHAGKTGPISVFAGSSINTYAMRNLATETYRAMDGIELSMSCDKDFLASRVAYKLNLSGPAVVVQSACSTSLVAVSLACQSLLDYQCDMAVAGGVAVKVPRVNGYLYKEGSINSPDGHCRAFDAKARGMVSGEGVATVVLKRLQDAVADGDNIRAVIKGFALNNDGANKVGYAAPSVDGQAEVIALAQAYADIEPGSIGYIEAHGTGTELGDPIEVTALTQAFRSGTQKTGFCGIGSVKSNIGHLDAAAGVTGLIKAVLALERCEIPPSLHFEKPSPNIDFAGSPFYVVDRLQPWPRGTVPRRAGASSFGIGGTNAHVVLEESPAPTPSAAARDWQLMVVSARSDATLGKATERLQAHLQTHPEQDLADVAYTLQTGRRGFEWRAFHTRRSGSTEPARWVRGHHKGGCKIAFAFPGQGAQYPHMGAGLYRSEPVYREAIDRCAKVLQRCAGIDIKALLYPASDAQAQAAERLRDTRNTQPALFATEYALAQLWQSWGIEPATMIGHSVGEFVAACLAGVLSLDDALDLIAVRARLIGDLPTGAMLSVPLAEHDVKPLLTGNLSLAAVNAPQLCVASGPADEIDALQTLLQVRGLDPIRLHTSHAFHSSMMTPALEAFRVKVECAKLSPPTRPYISNVTGTWITEKEATDPGYWVRHMREAVRFAEGVKCLLDDPEYVLLELGPGATLGGLARQQLDIAQMGRTVNVLGGPRDQGDDLENALDALGHLWLHGAAVDWQALAGSGRRRVALPTYPFERQRYWLEPSTDAVNLLAEAPLVKRADIADWFYAPSWRRMPLINVDTGSGEKFKHWLIFADNCGFGERLAARLVGDGMTATLVSVGTRFERLSDGNYRLALAEAEHYEKLLNDLTASGKLPQQVVHLWSLTGTNSSADDEIGRAFWSPLWLGRALGRLPDSDARQLSFISDGVQDVNGQEALSPQKSTLLGPWRVIQQEYPQLFCRSVDLVAPAANSAEESSLIDRLLAEFHLVATPDPVAYRGNQRWVRTYEPARLPARAPTTGLREHGVYLITGGLGGIGMAIAEDLASCVSARLVLIGRSAMPTRESWDKWLEEHPEADPVSRKIARLKAMEANGGEVMVACADVASEADMSVVIDQARQRFGAIHGVIHSAGVPAGGVIERKTRANAEAILSAKVGGTQVLDRLLADMPLDFMVLCSSLTAILGSPGQIDYTAANAYLDAYAEARNRDGNRHTLAIAWDGWSESGMAVDTEVPAAIKELRRKDLEMGIRDSEGAEVFRRALASGLSRAIVSTRDLARRLRLSAAAPKEEEGATQPDTAAVKHDRPELSTGFVAPRNDTERAVAAVWQELFGIGTIGVDDNFLEIGGHSLLAIQIVSRLDKELRIKLPVNVMFESPTVAQLAVLFEQAGQAKAEEERKLAEMLDMIENLSDEEVARLLAEREPE